MSEPTTARVPLSPEAALLAIHDLASARLPNLAADADRHTVNDLREIERIAREALLDAKEALSRESVR